MVQSILVLSISIGSLSLIFGRAQSRDIKGKAGMNKAFALLLCLGSFLLTGHYLVSTLKPLSLHAGRCTNRVLTLKHEWKVTAGRNPEVVFELAEIASTEPRQEVLLGGMEFVSSLMYAMNR